MASPEVKGKHEIPQPSDLVSFAHSAAGHDGVSSNASGSLVIKPCTQSEISFYESAQSHPDFLALIPVYIGTLTQNTGTTDLEATLGDIVPNQSNDTKAAHTAVSGIATPPVPIPQSFGHASPAVISSAWKPSGGKKIETGLAVVLENAAAGFRHPNILDAKLGARLWADDAPQAKRQRLDDVSSTTTSSSLGFRVAGMRIYQDGNEERSSTEEPHVTVRDGYKSYDKNYGRSFDGQSVRTAFQTYLGGVNPSSTPPKLEKKHAELIATRFLADLKYVRDVLEREESRMYSASVLMVYEGDESALEAALHYEAQHPPAAERDTDLTEEITNDDHDDDDENGRVHLEKDEQESEDEEDIPQVHNVKLIDFAHAEFTPGMGPDENALQGVRSLIKIFEELVDSR